MIAGLKPFDVAAKELKLSTAELAMRLYNGLPAYAFVRGWSSILIPPEPSAPWPGADADDAYPRRPERPDGDTKSLVMALLEHNTVLVDHGDTGFSYCEIRPHTGLVALPSKNAQEIAASGSGSIGTAWPAEGEPTDSSWSIFGASISASTGLLLNTGYRIQRSELFVRIVDDDGPSPRSRAQSLRHLCARQDVLEALVAVLVLFPQETKRRRAGRLENRDVADLLRRHESELFASGQLTRKPGGVERIIGSAVARYKSRPPNVSGEGESSPSPADSSLPPLDEGDAG